VAGAATPEAYRAFVAAYDWQDPQDPGDLYRELSIGSIHGTLSFLRQHQLEAYGSNPAWSPRATEGLYPIATLSPSALGPRGPGDRTLALARDMDTLLLVDAQGRAAPAGPTFTELLHYLALGWSQRDEVEDDLLGALQLRAHLRVGISE
jgi:hypothetical protein